MFLLLHFGQGDLQVVDVLLELGALVLQLALLGEHVGVHLLLVLQPLHQFLHFGLQLDLGLDEQVAAVLCVGQIVLLLLEGRGWRCYIGV